MAKTEKTLNSKTTYSSISELDNDLRPDKQQVKQVPTDIEVAKARTARTGESPVSFQVKGVNDK